MSPGMSRSSRQMRALAVVASLLPAVAGAQPAPAAGMTFRMPGECMHRLQLTAEICADVLERAWRHYLRNTPRFVSRGDCWRQHKVCIVLPAERVRLNPTDRFFTPFVWFAPPLWAIRLYEPGGERDFDVLIDRDMQVLEDHPMSPVIPAGRFAPPPETVRKAYLNGLRQEAAPPEAQPRSGRSAPPQEPVLQGLGPTETYPVAPARLRDMQRRGQVAAPGR
ncbi:MAG: hypothetical protein ACRCTI_10660 [Beijerinckiaceae bacterium]